LDLECPAEKCFVHPNEYFLIKLREQHILKGLMKLKKQEFLALKQGAMSVTDWSYQVPTDGANL
jgi:hypothetical protein